jgi:hypothetical protein
VFVLIATLSLFFGYEFIDEKLLEGIGNGNYGW